MKTIFSSATNNQIGGLFETLFLRPTAPYWYLYALFFIFLVTPTFRNRNMAIVGGVVALMLKTVGIIGIGNGVAVISYLLSNEIWFVAGMLLYATDLKFLIEKKRSVFCGGLAGILFLMLSVLIYRFDIMFTGLSTMMCVLGCSSVILLAVSYFVKHQQNRIFVFGAQYTMPIFLMHTLFAAPFRIILLKIGIQSAMVHVVLGIGVSFIGPVMVAMIMQKIKWLEFLLYPGKVLKSDSRKALML